MKSLLLFSLVFFSACASRTPLDQGSELSAEVRGIRVASLNYRIEGEKNLEDVRTHLDRRLEEAAAKNAAYVLIPELIVLDLFPKNPDEKAVKLALTTVAQQAPAFLEDLRELAVKHKIGIIGASYIVKEGNHFLNRAVAISPDGGVEFQDKVHPTPWEIRYGFKGASKIKTLKNKDFSYAILICHDAEFPEVSSALVFKRPEVLFVPSQTDDLAGLNRVFYTSSARSIEHMAYVVMTGTSSMKDAPWHSYQGRNILFTPQNKYFSLGFKQSSLEEELSYYDLDLTKIRESRRDLKQVYPARDFKRLQ